MTEWQTEIYQTAARTFEDLAFMMAGPESLAPPGTETMPSVGVAFSGPVNGDLLLRVTSDLFPVVAANMLGLDEAPDEARMWDALGETANIICGNVLPALLGTDAVFRLQGPRPVSPDHCAAVCDRRLAASVRMELEGGSAEILLFLDGGIHEAAL